MPTKLETTLKNLHKSAAKTRWEDSFKFQCMALKLPKALPQFRFHPKRQWKCDFGWPDYKLLVEIDGGIWIKGGKGAHSRPANIERDMEKSNYAQLLGYVFLRFRPVDVTSGLAVDIVQKYMDKRNLK